MFQAYLVHFLTQTWNKPFPQELWFLLVMFTVTLLFILSYFTDQSQNNIANMTTKVI